jgi:hypothetical protein
MTTIKYVRVSQALSRKVADALRPRVQITECRSIDGSTRVEFIVDTHLTTVQLQDLVQKAEGLSGISVDAGVSDE